ncbi:MAG: hypothetical protein E7256_09100 [Lachnospiraceae bacterium]|nr:hypothetical protein [Lachnospiraceae bacterium]
MRLKRRLFLLTIILLCVMPAGGCKKNEGNSEQAQIVQETDNVGEKNNDVSTGEETPTPTLELTDNKEMFIYSINSDTMEKESITAMISSNEEITPDLIVEKVVDSLEDASFLVGIDAVATSGDIVIVSFEKDLAPVANVNKRIETEILDVVAQSLLDNLNDYTKVVFRVMGEAYQSAHRTFGIDQVYLEKSN